MPHTTITPDSDVGQMVTRLGYAGLIPFVLLCFLMWVVNLEALPFVTIALSAYAATVASFLGGLHWGIGLLQSTPQRKLHMVWGVVPSLVAWVAVIMPAYAGLLLLALLLLVCYAVDRKTWASAGLREWLTMRFRLTVVATVSCVLGAAAT